MSIDSKLRRKVKSAVGKDNITGKENQDFYVPSNKNYPHLHFYDGGCELRNGNGGGKKLVTNSTINQANLTVANALGGSIQQAVVVIQNYYQ